MAERHKELFEAALELDADERAGFLDGACQDDHGLRDRLLGLLRAHDEAGDFLEHPTGLVDAIAADACEPIEDGLVAGAHLDHFELLERIGSGGFGSVWRARQEEPVVREVALKVLHAGDDAVRVAERFRAERQNLARMRHPGIAKVFDAGVTADGRSWMAMELIDGEPLVRHCEARGLGVAARLRLFVEVCRAVQHAHGKGVVHRDLKPSNVLIVERDGSAQPVIIDFGVAHARDERDAGLPFGTPEYMSPEQAADDHAAIDTGTDVYALGVLLYELIGGARPYARPEGPSGVQALLQRIREGAAPAPRLLPTAIVGAPVELDWIVAKAMAVHLTDRYETAAALAEDVLRTLRDEPVSVGPAGAGYRLRKLVRRHRGLVAAVAMVLLASSVGTFVAVRGWLAARDAERVSQLAEQRARDDQRIAERASQRAQRALDLLDDLWMSADPGRFGRADYPVRELVADFERLLPARTAGEPDVEFRVRLSLARLLRILGSLDRALAHASRATELGGVVETPAALPMALVELARVQFDRGALKAAMAAVDRGLTLVDEAARPRLAADLHETRANCLQRSDDWEGAVAAAEHAKALREGVGDAREIAHSALQLANLYGTRGRVDDALAFFDETRSQLEPYANNQPDALVALQHEAFFLLRRGDRAAAEQRLTECLKGRRTLYGPDHAQVAWTESDLGWLWHEMGRDAEAEPLLRHAVATLRERLGEGHLLVTETMQRLGATLTGLGDLDAAEALLRSAAERFRDLPGHTVDGRVGCLGNLASLQWSRRDREAAIETLQEALSIARKQLPQDHFVTSVTMTNLAMMQAGVGRRQQAAMLLTEALARSSAAGRQGEAHTQRERLAALLRELGREDEAAALERGAGGK